MSHHEDPAEGSTPPHPAAPPPAPPMAPAAAMAPAPAAHAGPDAAAKLEEAMAGLTKRFTTPELLAAGGALLVVAVFLVFGVLLGSYWPNDVAFATSALMLLVVVGQKMGWVDFGSSQRSLIIVLGFVLGVMLVNYFFYYLRANGFGRDGTFLIGLILAWIGQAAAAAGAFLTWQGRKA
jgi:hypothetical protein